MHLFKCESQIKYVQIFTYFVGTYAKIDNIFPGEEDYIEIDKNANGIKISLLFPLIINSMKKRGNWQLLTKEQALAMPYIDFVYTNAALFNGKGVIYPKLSLNTVNNYISNKKCFYEKFKKYPWILPSVSITNDKVTGIPLSLKNVPIIIKPDDSTNGYGILVQEELDKFKLLEHLKKFQMKNWTISQVFMPDLFNGYIVSNRVYLLVVKTKCDITSYIYKDHLLYRAFNKFQGDITDPLQFLTNITVTNANDFYMTRYINFNNWKKKMKKNKFREIKKKIYEAIWTISNDIKNDLMAINDNFDDNIRLHKKKTSAFHIYGLDILINRNNDIKILEINAHPSIDSSALNLGIINRFDYFSFWDDIMNITVDSQYEPLNKNKMKNKFKKIYIGSIVNNIRKPLFYIPQSICHTYPFILEALYKRQFINRTKNLYDNIDVFYGLRERYCSEFTNMYYYDELINFKYSKRMSCAKIINKIQGITYYLASKDQMYITLKAYIPDKIHSFVPESLTFTYPNDISYVKEFIENHEVTEWILKPIYGSRGMGIIKVNKHNITSMESHLNYWKNIGQNITVSHNLKNKYGNIIETPVNKKYEHWILSKYINKPYLIRFKRDEIGRKFNIRFFVLVHLDGHLTTINNHYGKLSLYVYSDCVTYFSMLEYNKNKIPIKFQAIDDPLLLESMKHLTNLENVNRVGKYLEKKGIKFDTEKYKKNLTSMLSNIPSISTDLFLSIMSQGIEIIKCTIDGATKNLRSLNRYIKDYKCSFNLLAYDMLLDDMNKLWLIEINRGPDMVALLANIGYNNCVKFFDEIFSITIDPYYVEKNINNDIKYWEKIK